MKKSKYFELESFEIKPEEVIVLHFEELRCAEMKYIKDVVENKFPNNLVICLPSKVSLERCNKSTLKKYLSNIISKVSS